MSCCSSLFRSVTAGDGASRGSHPPVRWTAHPHGAAGLGRRLSGVPRGRNTRRWGAGVLPVRTRCRRDRARQPVDRSSCPSRRSLATTRVWWPASGIRCTSGPAPRRGNRPATSRYSVGLPPTDNLTCCAARNPNRQRPCTPIRGLPRSGRVAITASMALSPRSMAALWLSGFEDDPEQLQCGELCVFEVFGRALGPAADPSAEEGVPSLTVREISGWSAA